MLARPCRWYGYCMGSEDIVGAYVEGRISRRTLVRRLMAAGVSIGAASAYAQLLASPSSAEAKHVSTYYDQPGYYSSPNAPQPWVEVVTSKRKRARKKGVEVKAGNANESVSLDIHVEAKRNGKWRKASKVHRVDHVSANGSVKVKLKVDKPTRKQLKKKKKVLVRGVALAEDAHSNRRTVRSSKRLT